MEKKVIYSLITLSAMSTAANAAAVQVDAYDFTKAEWGKVADVTFTSNKLTVSSGVAVKQTIGKLQKGDYILKIKVDKAGSSSATKVIAKIGGKTEEIAAVDFDKDKEVKFTLASETDVELELSSEPTDPKTPFAVDGFDLDLNFDFEAAISATLLEAQKVQTTIDGYTYSTQAEDKAAIDEIVNKLLLISASGTYADYEAYKLYDAEKALADEKAAITKLSTDSKNKEAKKTAYDAALALADVSSFIAAEADFKALKEVVANSTYTAAKAAYDAAKTKYEAYKKAADDAAASSSVTFDFTEDPKVVTDAVAALNKAIKAHQDNYAVYATYIAKYEAQRVLFEGADGKGGYVKVFNDWDATLSAADKASNIKPYQAALTAKTAASAKLAAYKKLVEDAYAGNNLKFATEPTEATAAVAAYNAAIAAAKANKDTYVTLSAKVATAIGNFTKAKKEIEDYLKATPAAAEALVSVVTANIQTLNTQVTTVSNAVTSEYQEGTVVADEAALDKSISDAEAAITKAVTDNKALKDKYNTAVNTQYQNKLDDVNGVTFSKTEYAAEAAAEKKAATDALDAVKAFIDSKAANIPAVTEESFKALISKADKAVADYKTRAQNVNDYHANLDDVAALQKSLDDAKKAAGDKKSADGKYTGAAKYTDYAANIQQELDAIKSKVEANKANGTSYKTTKEFLDAKSKIADMIGNYATWTIGSVVAYDAIVAQVAKTTAKTFTDDIAKVKASEVYASNYNGYNDKLTTIEGEVEKLNKAFEAAMAKTGQAHYDALAAVDVSYDFVGELKKLTDKLVSETDAYHLQVAINTYDTNLTEAKASLAEAQGTKGYDDLNTRIGKLTTEPQYAALNSDLVAVKSLIDTEAGNITAEEGKPHTNASEYNASSAELLKITEQLTGKIADALKALKTKVKAIEDNAAAKKDVDKEAGEVDALLIAKKAEAAANAKDITPDWSAVETAIAAQKKARDDAYSAATPTLVDKKTTILNAYKTIRTDIQNVVDKAIADQKAFEDNNKAYDAVFPLVAVAQKAINDATKAITDADALNPNGAKDLYLGKLAEYQTQLGSDATSGIWKKLVDAHNHTNAGTAVINEQKPVLEQMAKDAAAAVTNSATNLAAYNEQNTALAELRVYQKTVAQEVSDKLAVVKANPDAYDKDKITQLSELQKTLGGYLTEIDAIDLLTGFAAGESATNGKLDDIKAIDGKVRIAEAAIEDANNADIEAENVAKKAALDAAVKAARTTYNRVTSILSPYQTIKDDDLQAAFKPAADALSSTLYTIADNIDKLQAAGEEEYAKTKAPAFFDQKSDKIKAATGYETAILDAETTFKAAVQSTIDNFWKNSRKATYEGKLNDARKELSVWATTVDDQNAAIAGAVAKVKAAQAAYDASNVPALDDAVVALADFDAELTAEKQGSTLAHFTTELTNAENKLTALTFVSPYEDLNASYESTVDNLLNTLYWLRNNRLNNAEKAFTYRVDLQNFVTNASVDFAANFADDVAERAAAETQLNELQKVLDAAKAVVEGYTLDSDVYFKSLQNTINDLRGKSFDVQFKDYNKQIEDALLDAIDDEKDIIINALNTEYNKLLAADEQAATAFKDDVDGFKDHVTKLAPEGKALITDVAQLSSPYTEATEGSLTALLDGVTGDDNFWHSAWTGDKAKETVGSHYLQVEIAEPITTSTVYMEFTRRDKITTGHVTQWGVYGTNVPGATKSECVPLTTLSTPYVKLGEKITTDEFLTKGYKFIRLYIESTNSGDVFGHMSEFQLYTPDVAAESAALETLRDDAAQLSADMREAANKGLSAETLAGLNATIERLEGKTDFATDFPFADVAEYSADLTALKEFIAEKKAFIEKNASKILYYKEDLEVALDLFEANELDPTRAVYEGRNTTNETNYNNFVSRFNNLNSQTETFKTAFEGYDERTASKYSWYIENLEWNSGNAESTREANKTKLYQYLPYYQYTQDAFDNWENNLNTYRTTAAAADIQYLINDLNATYAEINAVLSDTKNQKDYAADVWADMLTRQSDISARITRLQNQKNDDTSYGSIFGNHDWLKDDAEYSSWSGSDYVTVEYSVTSIAADLEALLDQVRNGTLGDVDGDGEVNVTDYRTVLKFALENEDATAEDHPSYDVNQDGYIDVVDASAVVNVILYGDRRGEAYASVRGIEAGAQAAEAVALRVLNNDGETMRIAVDLTNNQAYTGFQLDVVLPEGMELIGQSLGERAANHDLLSNELSSGAIRIIGSSIKNEAFDGTEGAVLYLDVKRTDAYQGGSVAIEKVVFSDANAFATRFAVSSPIATGVSSTREQGIMGRIYDLGGRMVNSLKRGINIITGSDGTIRKVLK